MDRWSGVIGQYKDYNMYYGQENKKDDNLNILIFVVVFMFINNVRWDGVFFILVFGKQFDERIVYVRIVFKDNVYKV